MPTFKIAFSFQKCASSFLLFTYCTHMQQGQGSTDPYFCTCKHTFSRFYTFFKSWMLKKTNIGWQHGYLHKRGCFYCSFLNSQTWSTLLSWPIISFLFTILSRIPGWWLQRPCTNPQDQRFCFQYNKWSCWSSKLISASRLEKILSTKGQPKSK